MKNTFKKLFDTKFKKVAWFVFATIIILCAVFIRTVPNYSKKYGFEIVNLFDYNKYNQGYCLAENRILDKEELYKRAITQFLDRELEVGNMINNFRCKQYGKSHCKKYKLSYYKAKNYNLNEILKILENNSNYYIEDVVFNKIDIIEINPDEYIKINLDKMSAGFIEPVFYQNLLFLDYSFILYDNFIALNHSIFVDKFTTDFLSKYYTDKRKQPVIKTQFDNCGNVNIDVQKNYLQSREPKGG